jgi:hypothetical protein
VGSRGNPGSTGAGLSFDAARTLSPGGPEPVLAIGGDGTIYVAAQDAAGGPPRVWASTDGGKNFRLASPSTQSGGEVDIAGGGGASAYLTQLGPQGNLVSVSKDDGATWTPSPLGGLAPTYFDREWVAADSSGTVYLVSRELGAASGGAPTAAGASKSTDGGVSFTPDGTPWDAAHNPGTSNGNLVATGGWLAFPYTCGGGDAICFAAGEGGGPTWTQTLVAARGADVGNVYPTLASDGSTWVVAWSDSTSGRLAVWISSSTDDGGHWSVPWRASAGNESAIDPTLAYGRGGFALAYLATNASLSDPGQDSASQATWSAVAMRIDPASASASARGAPFSGPLHAGVISKPVGHPGTGPYDRSFGDFFTAAFDNNGRLWVSAPRTTDSNSPILLSSGS